ncbi:MAG: ribonuclease E/G [Pseudomonadota bacterium]
MLIDARHPEETRVAVVKGSRIEEFDFESAEHKQLKGNIYLAKVTRVEPSLQAAFIDYGGNRHGFLAFSEIHPDYYQIPKSDRDALLREEAEHAAEEERLRAAADDFGPIDDHHDDDGHDDRLGNDDDHDQDHDHDHDHDHDQDSAQASATTGESGTGSSRSPVDESAADELRKKRQALRRRYKIQDVIQRRQVLLVQVVKEERGNKGAALTTYLSLAGRYCVLMPNTSHGGGISRKISNGSDRKRLKSIMSDLNLPKTMGLIVRTAGLQRTKTEIKRDFDYLARLWDEIRERTLGSTAPALIYRDSDLIKRAIRDLYHRDIDEVIVEGEDGYKSARNFMKLLMPSHVKRVSQHNDTTPLFQRHGVEDQLSAMYQPLVQLKSGGYLVINPTEALVSIDINSGRSTREHNIEQTAFMTNIEAAAEIARQLRLRDMAGLVVIDFIDMEQNSHIRKVEKAMKDALKNDRARIQVGRISGFGLMEMSRQRLRTGVLEASTKACPHCEGSGLMRTASSSGLSALRMIEDEATRGRGEKILLRAGREAAVYVLNRKRAELAEIEARYGVSIEVAIDESFEGAKMAVESAGPRPTVEHRPQAAISAPVDSDDDDDDFVEDEVEDDSEDEAEDTVEISLEGHDDDEDGQARESRESRDDDRGEDRSRRRRRRGGRGRGRNRRDQDGQRVPETGDAQIAAGEHEVVAESGGDEGGEAAGGDRRRRRRSRRPRQDRDSAPPVELEQPIAEIAPVEEAKPKGRRRKPVAAEADAAPAPEEAPAAKPARKVSAKATAKPEDELKVGAEPSFEPTAAAKASRAKPKSGGSAKAVSATAEKAPGKAKTRVKAAPAAANSDSDSGSDEFDENGEPRRGGWWQRTFG